MLYRNSTLGLAISGITPWFTWHRLCRWVILGSFCTTLCLSPGCSIGPVTMERDRLDYQSALAESWKRQVLLNLVRIRYSDTPVFLELSSIISQYSTEARVDAGVTLSNPPWSHSDEFGGSVTYADKPTMTYVPLTGERFARSLFTPIPPAMVISLVQAGWPVDSVLRQTCTSINGIHNQSLAPAMKRKADPEFEELLTILRRIQLEDAIAVRIEKKGAVETTFVIFGPSTTNEGQADRARVREILKLDPEVKDIHLVYGTMSSSNSEVAIQTRSMSQLLVESAGCIEVPPEHIRSGKTYATSEIGNSGYFIRIHSGVAKPKDTFAEVKYRGVWFWVDDGDFVSKRTLSVLLMFFSLVETGGGAGAPVVTVQAG